MRVHSNHGHRRSHFDSGNSASSESPDPVPQKVGSGFNLAVTNRITSRFAARLPGFAILTHVGRKSGRVYQTPVNVFRVPEGFVIALTYGRESEWVKNVLAAGRCELETRGRRYQLSSPTIVHDPTRRRFPILVRIILRLNGASDFMRLSTSQNSL